MGSAQTEGPGVDRAAGGRIASLHLLPMIPVPVELSVPRARLQPWIHPRAAVLFHPGTELMDSRGPGLPEQQDTSPSGVDIPMLCVSEGAQCGDLVSAAGALAAENGHAQDLCLQQKRG